MDEHQAAKQVLGEDRSGWLGSAGPSLPTPPGEPHHGKQSRRGHGEAVPQPFGVLAVAQLSAKPLGFSRKHTKCAIPSDASAQLTPALSVPTCPLSLTATNWDIETSGLGQEGTKCWQCVLWIRYRLINGNVKQHGDHCSHPPHPSFTSRTNHVCSAGLHISAGHWAVEAMQIEPGRLFQRAAIADFIYSYLPKFLLLILKSFLHDCISLAGVPKATNRETPSAELQGGNRPLCRGSAGLLEKSYDCGTGLLLPLCLSESIFWLQSPLSKVPTISSPLKISAHFDINLQAPGSPAVCELEYTGWDFQPPGQWLLKP